MLVGSDTTRGRIEAPTQKLRRRQAPIGGLGMWVAGALVPRSFSHTIGGASSLASENRAESSGFLYLQYISVPRDHLVEDRVYKEAQEQA